MEFVGFSISHIERFVVIWLRIRSNQHVRLLTKLVTTKKNLLKISATDEDGRIMIRRLKTKKQGDKNNGGPKMTKFETILVNIAAISVPLFAHRSITYQYTTPKHALLAAFVLLIMLKLLIESIRKKEFSVQLSYPNLLWFVFGMICLFSTIKVFLSNRIYFPFSVYVALYVILFGFIALYFSNRFTSKKSIVSVLLSFQISSLIVSINGLINFYTGFDLFVGESGRKFDRMALSSTIGNPIFTANFLTMVMISSIYLIFSDDYGWESNRIKLAKFVKWFVAITFLVNLIAFTLCLTRSEYLGFGVALLIFFVLYRTYSPNKSVDQDATFKRLHRTLKMVLILSSIAILIVFNIPSKLNRKMVITQRLQFETVASNMEERLVAWRASIEQWKHNKLIGEGIATFRIRAIDWMQNVIEKHPESLYVWGNFKSTHNDYLQILGETGLIGLGIIVLFIISTVVYAFKYLSKANSKDEIFLFLSLGCSFIVYLAQSFFSFPSHFPSNTLFAAFVFGVATGKYFNHRKVMTFEIKVKGFQKVLCLTAIYLLTIAVSYFSWTNFIAQVSYKAGLEAYVNLRAIKEHRNNLLEYRNFYEQKLAECDDEDVLVKLTQDLEKINKSLAKTVVSEVEMYQKALSNLIVSAQMSRTYGEAFFHLAFLAPGRSSEMTFDLLTGKFTSLRGKYDAVQKLIAPIHNEKELEFMEQVVKEKPQIAQQVAEFQVIIDAIGLLKTSSHSLNDIGIYDGIAKFSAAACKIIDRISETLNKEERFSKNIEQLRSLREKYFSMLLTYAKMNIDKAPGSWNVYPDRKNIDLTKALEGQDVYRSMAKAIFEVGRTDKRAIEMLLYLAEKEVWACKYMYEKGVWAVPDGVIEYLLQIIIELERTGQVDKAMQLKQIVKQTYEPAAAFVKEQIEKIDLSKAIQQYSNRFQRIVEDLIHFQVDEVVNGFRQTLVRLLEVVEDELKAEMNGGVFSKLLGKELLIILTNKIDVQTTDKILQQLSSEIPFEILLWERLKRFERMKEQML
ncbi:O-antigen ligase family protein [Pseudothermotoga thermarum]|nr:O-antigen ligase [Pseudothermotoga thermarum]